MVSFSRYCGCAFLGAVVICVLICGARPTQATPPSGYTLLFHDEFNQGALDQNDWYYRTGLRRTCYDLARNAWVAPDGILHLAFANADPAYRVDGVPKPTGGGIISRHLFGYGYYEARARLYTKSPGLHTSFWSCGSDDATPTSLTEDPHRALDLREHRFPMLTFINEIDGFEHYSPDQLEFGDHEYSAAAKPLSRGAGVKAGIFYGVNYGDWNVYGYEYTPTSVRYYLNNKLRFTIDLTKNPAFIHSPMFVWLTTLAESKGPADAAGESQFSYFRFYAKPLPGINLVGNPGFNYVDEHGGAQVKGWVAPEACNIVNDGGRRSLALLEHDEKVSQRLEYIPNGIYRLTVRAKSREAHRAQMRAAGYDGLGSVSVGDIPASAGYTKLSIANIKVTNNNATISLLRTADGAPVLIDQVSFAYVGPLPAKTASPGSHNG